MKNKFLYQLIVGLGNPGSPYASTYHNAGWLALDCFIKKTAETMTLAKKGKQTSFEFFKFNNDDKENIIFVKPLTFMNESGKAVLAATRYFSTKDKKIKPKEILIIHDDADIELGKIKLSFGQGAAGHHGVESVIKNLKTKNFWRIRIGIRPKTPNDKNQAPKKKAGGFVLEKITPADELILERLFESGLTF